MLVPVGPRADRESAAEDPFVTPPRGIEASTPAAPREPPMAPATEPEMNVTPTAPATTTGFTPRPDRLAEPLSADNAQGRLRPQHCIFVAK
jgi:hypothetical protein